MASAVCHSRLPSLAKTSSTGRVVITKPRRSAFSSATRTTKKQHLPLSSQRPCIVARIPPKVSTPATPFIRHNSTSSTPTASAQPLSDLLTWDRFFDLRRKRRFVNLGSSVITAVGAVGIFAPMLAQQDLDKWAAQMAGIDLDPMVVFGLTTFMVAAGGWLCGPSVGNLGFKTWAGRRGWNQGIAEKEKSFYDRIKRYRGDPSASSLQNPIPDYYGEKIASVKDYRRWLKDQRAFTLKRDKAFV